MQKIKVAVDAVVFGYQKSEGLTILLIKRKEKPFKDSWALPGGLVKNEESLDAGIKRELEEETGVSINYLEQLYSFGAPKRDPRNRVISISYFALVRPDAFELKASTDAKDARWFPLDNIPKLAFDHKIIVKMAMERVKAKMGYAPIGFELLDKTFPFSDLEKLYTTVLGREIDRRNFQKRIKASGLLIDTGKKQILDGPGRPGPLFKFDRKRYKELMREGYNFEVL